MAYFILIFSALRCQRNYVVVVMYHQLPPNHDRFVSIISIHFCAFLPFRHGHTTFYSKQKLTDNIIFFLFYSKNPRAIAARVNGLKTMRFGDFLRARRVCGNDEKNNDRELYIYYGTAKQTSYRENSVTNHITLRWILPVYETATAVL